MTVATGTPSLAALQPAPAAALLAVGWVYVRGVRALWRGRPGRGVRRHQALSFAGGLAALAAALVEPFPGLGQARLSAHMVQHLLLTVVVPPLLVLGGPHLALPLGLPPGWRAGLHRLGRWAVLAGARRILTHPLVAWTLAGAALWAWHAPAAYQAALEDQGIHAVEHLSFLATALLFWWVALPPAGARRLPRGADVVYVVTGSMQGAVVGALFAFAPQPLYPFYRAAEGAGALRDQQLAGAIMWVPSFVIYLVAAAGLFVAWLRDAERQVRRAERRAARVGASL